MKSQASNMEAEKHPSLQKMKKNIFQKLKVFGAQPLELQMFFVFFGAPHFFMAPLFLEAHDIYQG